MRQVHDNDRRRGAWSEERKAAAAERKRQDWQDPEKRARIIAGTRKAFKSPDMGQRIQAGKLNALTQRDKAKAAVREAGLTVWKRHVDDAVAMIADGQSFDAIVSALRARVAA